MAETWKLDDEQRVVYVHHRYVYFHQKKNTCSFMIFLNFQQVDILNEIIQRYFLSMRGDESNLYFPLGGGVVFMFKNNRACLQYLKRRTRRYILFHCDAWNYYTQSVHSELMSLVRHERSGHRCKCALANVRNCTFGHTRNFSYPTKRGRGRAKREIFSRQTAYDAMENPSERHRSLFHQRGDSSDREDSDSERYYEDETSHSMDAENEGNDDSEH